MADRKKRSTPPGGSGSRKRSTTARVATDVTKRVRQGASEIAETIAAVAERPLNAAVDALTSALEPAAPTTEADTAPPVPSRRDETPRSRPSGTSRPGTPARPRPQESEDAPGAPPPTRDDTAPAEPEEQKEDPSAAATAEAVRETLSGIEETIRQAAPSLPSPAVTAETFSLLGDGDLHFFNEGTHHKLYEKLGAHLVKIGQTEGAHFAIWAPDASEVTVMGDFNGWDKGATPLRPRGSSGVWEGFVPGVSKGATYKYHVVGRSGYYVDKADPFGFMHETPPKTGSVVWDLDYEWGDARWMETRAARNAADAPVSIYELHTGSWRRSFEGTALSYRELAAELVDYVKQMGFTHVELMPVMEHPFYGSWGYQVTGFFAPTSRFGSPQDLMFLIDHLHQNDIGVILDWVPSHFPTDEHGLAYFDGTHLFEHADPRQGFHPDWKSYIFNYGRNEVRSFLLSSAMFWLEQFHADGLRVDAVASMLYLDYSRKEGEWIPNPHGGRENIDAIGFLRRMNEDLYKSVPGIQTIAEESTAWPMVSRPTYLGGLGFGMKWDMGWMHDTLRYMSHDPVHRRFHHNALTFRMLYAFTENFVLPLSHDEVVHGKGSLLAKMPGDDWRKFANLRLLFAWMYAQPGKKLMFMGGEFGQWREWNHDTSLDWHLLESFPHAGLQRWVTDLNHRYRELPALHQLDFDPTGFEWIDCCDTDQSIVTLMRRSRTSGEEVVAAFNFTPVTRSNYRVGVPGGGWWLEVLNSDANEYGGSGQGNFGRVEAAPVSVHGRPYTLNLTLPPLAALFFRKEPVSS